MLWLTGALVVLGLSWLALCEYMRSRLRTRDNFPTGASFWAGLAGPTGCLLCCAVALGILIAAIIR
jgi:hypothetical protein